MSWKYRVSSIEYRVSSIEWRGGRNPTTPCESKAASRVKPLLWDERPVLALRVRSLLDQRHDRKYGKLDS